MHEIWSNVAGGYVRYVDLPGERTPIVFVHGLGCAGSFDYPEVAAQPVLAGHRRLLIDLPGAGYSDAPADFGYQVTDHAAMLVDLLTALPLPPFILFGHSAGGAIAIEVARTIPGRLAGLVLSESNLDPSPPSAFSYMIASQSEASFLESGYEQLLAESSDDKSDRIWAASLRRWPARAVWRLSRSLTDGRSPNGREALYEMAMPRVYLIGDQSLSDPDLDELPRHGIATLLVPDAGHAMAYANPQATAAAIGEALDLMTAAEEGPPA